MLTKYRLQLVLLVILFGSLTFKVNNAFDSLPSARAFVSNWLNHDWYLSQFVPYRFLFNIPVGSLYKLTNFWFTFFSTKFVLFCAFTFVLARIYEKLNVSLLVLIISFTYFLNNQSLVAMEWIVGDSDAKPVAYILFFFALKDFISNKLSPKTFFLLGLSASFHVLVGGYLSITFFLALLFFKIIPKVKWILAFLLGSSIALYAVFYELGQESVHLADQIYIFTRLSHHLVPEWDVNRWLWKYVLFNGFLIWGYLKKDEVWKRFISLALITNIFWIMGLVVYYLGYHHLLKYYFFRVPDSLIPFTSYLVITSLLLEKVPSKFKEHKALIPLVFIIFSFRFSGQLFDFWDKQKSYPTKEIYSWIDQNVASDAVILANPSATNFFAHTNRSIYVSYKHLPQIKEFLIQYHRRLEFVLGRDVSYSESLERPEINKAFEENLPHLKSEDLKREGITHILSPIELNFTLLKSVGSFYLYQIQ